MQTVGQPCEICGKSIKSEIDGVGCVTCQRFFHDACLLAPPKEEPRSETYRAPADAAQPKKPKKRKVRCPGCGADVRKELRERHLAATHVREAHEEHRRVAQASRGEQNLPRVMAIRGAFALLFILGSILVRCAHP